MKNKTTITIESDVWQKLQFRRVASRQKSLNEVIKDLIEKDEKKTD